MVVLTRLIVGILLWRATVRITVKMAEIVMVAKIRYPKPGGGSHVLNRKPIMITCSM
jgi:hypothetical protein